MRVTIIPVDSFVGVDGEFRSVDLGTIDPNIHAVQWDGTKGEIEFNDRSANRVIDTLEPYQRFVDAWVAAAPPPPPPPIPRSEQPLETEELTTLLVNKGLLTVADVDAVRASRS